MRATPILKGRIVDTLRARLGSEVQLDSLKVRITSGIDVAGNGLRIFAPEDLRAAGVNKPVIAVEHFDFRISVVGLLQSPTRVSQVRVRGLALNVPPANLRGKETGNKRHTDKVKIEVSEIVCDDSKLVIGTDKPDKDPRVFVLKHLVLRDFGPHSVWPFDAILTNAVPRGEIHARGSIGPWDAENPGDSRVDGKYVFEHADLYPIKGIGGILRSEGSFSGQVNRIAVEGRTQTPDFSLDTANHPMPLTTEFQAIVDGTSGDTYLNHIEARLGSSNFTCHGAVVDVKGQGHTIDVTTDVPAGQIGDFLGLAVKTSPAPMTGVLTLHAQLHIAPGKESVSRKMTMRGSFTLRQIHFTNPAVEDKVDFLSLRARGKTNELKPGAPDVTSKMTGTFAMQDGQLAFSRFDFELPGGNVHLTGHYRLDGRTYDFAGTVRTRADVSQMIASRWKSLLLTPLDPFFSKNGWGAVIHVKVTSGNDGKPKFGIKL